MMDKGSLIMFGLYLTSAALQRYLFQRDFSFPLRRKVVQNAFSFGSLLKKGACLLMDTGLLKDTCLIKDACLVKDAYLIK